MQCQKLNDDESASSNVATWATVEEFSAIPDRVNMTQQSGATSRRECKFVKRWNEERKKVKARSVELGEEFNIQNSTSLFVDN